jgi:hypothetical protein
MTDRKKILLRLDPMVHDALARWAGDELRSTNAQIEFLLRRALAEAGRLPTGVRGIPRRGRPPRTRSGDPNGEDLDVQDPDSQDPGVPDPDPQTPDAPAPDIRNGDA